MHQRCIAVEREDDRLVRREQRIVVALDESVRVLGARLQAHEVNHVDDANLDVGHRFSRKDGDRCERFQRRRVAAAGHDDIRLTTLIVTRPLPDPDSLGAMDRRLLHAQPLRQRVLSRHDYVDVVTASQAMVDHR